MKKISTLLLSSLFSLSLLAYDGSRLSVSTFSSNTDLKIEIDGRRVAMQDNSVILSNIAEGQHSIKIYKERRRNGFGNGNGYGNGNGNSNGNGFGRRQEVIYSGTVFVKRGFHTDIVVNRFGKVFVDERRIERRDAFDNEDDDYVDDGSWNNGYNNGFNNVMNARDFDQVKESLRKEWFDNNRIISSRFIIENNNFTTAQVKEMMQLFTFDDKKLEVAKLAYRKTVDKQNYYQVNETLTFNSSKEELARFIRESR